jgi:hypothetical protein
MALFMHSGNTPFHPSLLRSSHIPLDDAMEQYFFVMGSGTGYAVVVLAVFWYEFASLNCLSFRC